MSLQTLDYNMILWMILLLTNLSTYVLFFIDKKRAMARKRNRIPERKLLLASFLAGGIGGFLAMTIHRHKTKHTNFKILVPIGAILTGILMYLLWSR